jgi:hypothetical protein
MKKIFQARITWYQYAYLIGLVAASCYLFTDRLIFPAVGVVIILTLSLDHLLSTTYTLTEGKLIISRGRFLWLKIIPVKEIRSIAQKSSASICGFSLFRGVVIEYIDGAVDRRVLLRPREESTFVDILEELKTNADTDEIEDLLGHIQQLLNDIPEDDGLEEEI